MNKKHTPTDNEVNAKLITIIAELLQAAKIGLSYAYSIDCTSMGQVQPVLDDRKFIEQAIAKAEGV